MKEDFNRSAFDGFRETSPYYMGKMDLWYGFACHGIDMLTRGGILSFIAQNNWTTSAGAKKLRNCVISKTMILQLLDFNEYMVFSGSASIQTMIMLFKRNDDEDNYTFDLRSLGSSADNSDVQSMLNLQTNSNISVQSPIISRHAYLNRFLTFSSQEDLLKRISEGKFYLTDKETTNGIHPHYDFVNSKIHKLHPEVAIGEGIFGLTFSEKAKLNLSPEEESLIKPYYTSNEIHHYYTEKHNALWLIYTTSDFKNPTSMEAYPNIKRHLDRYQNIITSCNKPYGLHRSRNENFFIGEKIVALRKCPGSPLFSYSDFDCYVSAAFYVIKSDRWDMKFLTGILCSNVVKFWLKNKGKMQGANYQLDKEPLSMIPLPDPSVNQGSISSLVQNIIEGKRENPNFDSSELEKKINAEVYAIYGLDTTDISIIEEV